MILFECPYCAAQLEIGEDRAGRSMTCPFCKGQVEVPKLHKPRRRGEYDLEEDGPAAGGSLASGGVLTAADIAALEEDEGPRKKKRRRPKMEWQLFVGGFGFPWSPGAVMQWLLIALWAMAAGWLTHSAIVLGIDQPLGGASMYQTIVASLSALGAVLAGVGCTGVAAIHGLTILLETTAGNDRMENWPNVCLFLDWIGDLWFMINTAAVSVVLGLGLAWLMPGLLGVARVDGRHHGFLPVPDPSAMHLGDRLAVLAGFERRLSQPGAARHRLAGVLPAGRQFAGSSGRAGLLSGSAA